MIAAWLPVPLELTLLPAGEVGCTGWLVGCMTVGDRTIVGVRMFPVGVAMVGVVQGDLEAINSLGSVTVLLGVQVNTEVSVSIGAAALA